MEAVLSRQEIYTRMSGILIEALRVDPSTLSMEANLFYDLGAESIDMLDIRFRMQEAFAIEVDREELIRSVGETHSNDELVRRFDVGALVRYVEQKLSMAGKLP